jgi:hypothetical protein
MEIKGFCSDCTIEEVQRIFEEQYECSRREPTTVNIYLDSTSDSCSGICKHSYAVNTICIFSKEQAVRIATEEYKKWKSHESSVIYDGFITSMKTVIKFDVAPAKTRTLWLHQN